MKISKIPGLGRFGVFIDDIDFYSMTEEEWIEIGQLHLKSLVTIFRNVNLDQKLYEKLITKHGTVVYLAFYRMIKKYQTWDVPSLIANDVVNGIPVDPDDKKWAATVLRIMSDQDGMSQIVSGKKNEKGEPLGMFAEGELLWHSNESGNLCFAPGVALLGVEGTIGSATGFLTTADWYEEQTESFRSELDEMIIEHKFTPGRINPGLRQDQDDLMYKNMCPIPNELPLVMQNPIGIKGLHYSVNTIEKIKGMTQEESQSVFDYINKTLFVDKYIYDHWYQQDNDLSLFDNSITLHRRLGGIASRTCYRIQYQYNKLVPDGNPYLQEPFISMYNQEMGDIKKIFGM
jgi:alpha-ketoglutarate-dependent taurine dioxygenase